MMAVRLPGGLLDTFELIVVGITLSVWGVC